MSVHEAMRSWYVGFQEHILTRPELAPLRAMFPFAPEALTDFTVVMRLHRKKAHEVMRSLSSDKLAFLVRAIDSYIRGPLGVTTAGLPQGRGVDSIVGELTRLGHASLPTIDPAKVKDMREYFERTPCYAGPYSFEPDLKPLAAQRTSGARIANYATPDVLACPHLINIANNPTTIAALTRYLGAVPTVVEYAAWWSFAVPGEPQDAQLFHYDHADYRFCLMFIYLTDVDENGGPHAFVEGTHELHHIDAARTRWTDRGRDGWEERQHEFDAWFFTVTRKTDADVARYFGKSPVHLTGPAGTSFLSATRGQHKGTAPRTRERLVCQVVYTVSPYTELAPVPLKLGRPETAPVAPWLKAQPYRYINRLFLENGTAA